MAAGRLDRELQRYLVPGERVVTVVRQHWLSQLRPIAIFVGLLFLATFVEAEAPRNRSGAMLANFFWYAVIAGALYLLWRWLNWRHDWFVATDKRFLLFYGFIRRKVAMMPLMKVTDMTFDRSIMGRMFGYGTFLLESAGQEQALSHIEYVPKADKHYHAICTVLFGSEDAARDPEDEWGDGDDFDDDGDDDGRGGPSAGPHDGWDGAIRDEWDDPHGWRDYLGRDGRGSGQAGIRNPVRDRHDVSPPHETLYRSSDLLHASRLEDTGEIPVIRPRNQRRPGRKGMR
ncbi:PH domain-containing protein [Knoellia subterranea]|uniref:Membrane protein n=1 Tax=Knoellia subterranea KCTC 19937 TaxID=1385521 RepID=A0A0A0JJJ4_9MICO|nr:PH domain-containing protein [Knoellia subterranea]KGN37268.1 membrane protein [Knoellia subterranea KCTC 19937]